MGIIGLETVVNEMDVQSRYRSAFENYYKGITIQSKFGSDGIAYFKEHKLRMIIEQKHKCNLNNLLERSKVTAQILAYLKKIHDNSPGEVPKVAVIGDEDECLVLPVKDIINYISISYKWSLAPSNMWQDKELIKDLVEDPLIKKLYIYNPKNDFDGIINRITNINLGVEVPRTMTEKNIDRVYEYFVNKVKITKKNKSLKPNDSVNLFAHIMLKPDSLILNEKTNLLHTSMFKEPLRVNNSNAFNSFIGEFSRKYTPKQKHYFTSILDRLIEDTTRRKQGEFFTPTIWVDKAHEYIASVYGENWKEEYVVWDPAWGTGNLTRDYKFRELYVSTLNQSDIDTANQMGYNPEATKFQYDFLNDDYKKLPEGLRKAIEGGRQIIVLMNPPYATSSEMKLGNSKQGVGFTIVNSMMNEEKLDRSASQLYAQFIYKLTKMGKMNLCLFSNPLFLTGQVFKVFRQKVLSKYNFKKGFMIDAAEFADVESWGLSFSIFSVKK